MDIANFYELVIQEDIDTIESVFGTNQISFNTPIEGSISSKEDLRDYVSRFSSWVETKELQVHHQQEVKMDPYTANEYLISGEEFELPIALVGEFKGDELVSLRDYHSTWPLYGDHRVRAPFLKPQSDLEEPQPVERYMQYLKEGNTKAIVKLFAQDAYFREPSGSAYRYQGHEELEELYTTILRKGGIHLSHCTAIVDTGIVGIEFIATKWGDTDLPHQAGIAFYEYTDTQLLAARVYDDVEPPL